MIRKPFAETVLLALVTFATFATFVTFATLAALAAEPWARVADGNANVAGTNGLGTTADLRIREFVFPADNDKAVRVDIVNTGGVISAVCILRLTVRKINGVPAGRVMEVKLPPLGAGKHIWLAINAKSILPNNVSLASTTFKLNADATSIVSESDEANNEIWHNL